MQASEWKERLGIEYYDLGKNEQPIMQALWAGAKSSREAYNRYVDTLENKEDAIAFSTFVTELLRMSEKGYITRKHINSREYEYAPIIASQQVMNGELAHLYYRNTGHGLPQNKEERETVLAELAGQAALAIINQREANAASPLDPELSQIKEIISRHLGKKGVPVIFPDVKDQVITGLGEPPAPLPQEPENDVPGDALNHAKRRSNTHLRGYLQGTEPKKGGNERG